MAFSCEPIDDLEPQALGVTYWFDTPTDGEPFTVKVRYTGRRSGVKGKAGKGDAFDVVETLEDVLPGSGPVAVTTWLSDVTPGEWQVTAAGTIERPGAGGAAGREPRSRRSGAGSAAGKRLPSASSTGRTGYAPVIRVRAPGARLGAWPGLVSLGVVVALIMQSVLARRNDLPATRILLISLVASLIGLVGAKVYYYVEHRGRDLSLVTAGMCIQGFVLGAVGALVVESLLFGVSVGQVVDVSTPGLLFAMCIGRFGCFFGGCCVGRPTGSRWGLWSSDRRLGLRRIPTQLLESTLAFSIGLVALVAVLARSEGPAGTIFVASIAAYTLGRQLLFPLRDLPRHTHNGRTLTMVIAGAIALAAVGLALFT
ncbi:MAG: prolipoprotein diacylglyceryl transferase [Actinobacteria bacterium]|nr:prolipoprotein diacylglyceryl transferase [Actinomycetota bacterium]